ncbi:MAG: tetratricopeptide repeat protein [Dehalococcoidia bacterium]
MIENDLALMLTERFAGAQVDGSGQTRASLPVPLTRFFGREDELEDLVQRLRQPRTRLVTLVGPGGVGKSRLALESARRLSPQFEGQVVFVSLAPVDNDALVLQTIARALDVREASERPLVEAIADRVHESPVLLLLDNFEHLIEGAASLSELLLRAPSLTALVTSREPLRIQGEQLVTVLPLPLAGEAVSSPAIALFVDRARAVDPTFELNSGNIKAIAELCQRLDRLPLAIELVAARISMLSPTTILARLDSALTLAARGGRDLPERQRTMRNTIDWSYGLLTDDERVSYERLAVFAGRITPQSAHAVCQLLDEETALDTLDALAHKSLLQRERDRAGGLQFRLLNAVRSHGLERLAASGERAAVEARYVRYFIDLVDQTQPRLFSPEYVEARDLLDIEYENVRATLSESEGDNQAMAQLVYGLFFYWYRRGLLSEGRRWAEGGLERSGATGHERGMIASGAGSLAMWQGDLDGARNHYEASARLLAESPEVHLRGVSQFTLGVLLMAQGEAVDAAARLHNALAILATSQDTRDRYFCALSLMHLGNVGMSIGHPADAVASLNDALELGREVGDAWLVASILTNMGEVARISGDYERAAAHYQEALTQFEQTDDRGDAARLLCCLAFTACRLGEFEQAMSLLDRSIGVHEEFGSKRGIAECLLGYAQVLSARSDEDRRVRSMRHAAMLLAASERQMRTQGAVYWTADLAEHDKVSNAVIRALSHQDLDDLRREGERLSLAEIRELVRG